MKLRFDGRVAVVTGAGRGVGRGYARLLAARGASVLVNDLGGAPDGTGASTAPAHRVAEEIRAGGGIAVADTRSVAVEEQARQIVAHALDEFGRLDILINNAGYVQGGFRELIDVNLGAAHWLTEAAWPEMAGRGYGRILLTTSSSGLFGAAPGPGYSPMQSYAATKLGVLGLGRCLAVRGRSVGIAVNMISPCAGTRLVAGLERNPRMRWVSERAQPELVAPAAAFLVHESCPVSGEVFAAGAGRVARIFVGETTGYVNPELTVEDVAAHFGRITDETGYHVPEDMDAVVDLYMKTVGGT